MLVRKRFANDLKTIYQTPLEEAALQYRFLPLLLNLQRFFRRADHSHKLSKHYEISLHKITPLL